MLNRRLYSKEKISVFILLMTGMLMAQPGWSAPSLTIGSNSATPGQSVAVPVDFTNDGTVVSLQFDVQYDNAFLTTGTPTAGAALGSNGLASAEVIAGTRRVVITPTSGNAVLGSGTVATMPFGVNASAGSSVQTLAVSNVVMTTASTALVSSASPDNGTVTINAVNTAPTANAGGPYSGAPGSVIVFDGSGSSDPENDPLTYFWDFGNGAGSTGVSPSQLYPSEGTYTVRLTVNDGQLSSSRATTTVSVSIGQ